MVTVQLKKNEQGRLEKTRDTSVSFYQDMLEEIDQLRGDTSRSLWIRRAAARELERLKNERNNR